MQPNNDAVTAPVITGFQFTFVSGVPCNGHADGNPDGHSFNSHS